MITPVMIGEMGNVIQNIAQITHDVPEIITSQWVIKGLLGALTAVVAAFIITLKMFYSFIVRTQKEIIDNHREFNDRAEQRSQKSETIIQENTRAFESLKPLLDHALRELEKRR